jgi:SOS-response transcriptional repressor LexA
MRILYKNTFSKYNFQKVLNYIIQYKKHNDGNSPTFRSIMTACDITSTSIVSSVLRRMEREGMIRLRGRGHKRICVVGGRWTYEPQEKE